MTIASREGYYLECVDSENFMSALAPKATGSGRKRFRTSFLREAERRGLVGVIAGPTDLATNRKRYLKRAVRGRTRSAAR